jgi:hypothetical protein
MPLLNPQGTYGFNNVNITNLANPSDSYFARVVGSIDTGGLAAELITLQGGASYYAYSAAPGRPDSTISLTLREPTNKLLSFFTPVNSSSLTETLTPTATATVSNFANLRGTSVNAATGGISAVAIAPSGDNLVSYGNYTIIARTSSTFDLYIDNDLQADKITIQGGADGLTPQVTLTTLTRGAAATNVDFNGIRFTAGSGTAAFVVGDAATFTITPPNNYTSRLVTGVAGSTNKSFSMSAFGEVRPSASGPAIRGMIFRRCVASGSPVLSLTEKEWVEYEVTVTVLDNGSAGAVENIEVSRALI